MPDFVVVLLLVAVLVALTEAAQAVDRPCASELEQWNEEFLRLKQGIDAYRLSKQEDISSRIEESISRTDRNSSIAETVQEVLRDRAQRIESVYRRCRELGAQEATAFNIYNRCASPGSRKKNSQMNEQAPASVREREILLGDLNQMLLDDAYLQYKKQQPVPRFDYSGGYAERTGGPQDWGSSGRFQRGGNSQGGFPPPSGSGR